MKFLSINDVAESLGRHPVTVTRACQSGAIPAIKAPGSKTWRIPESYLSDLVEAAYARVAEAEKAAEPVRLVGPSALDQAIAEGRQALRRNRDAAVRGGDRDGS